MALRNTTSVDLMRLQLWGSLWMNDELHTIGLQPQDIEAYFRMLADEGSFNAMMSAMTTPNVANINKDASITATVLQTAGSLISNVPVVGAIIGAVLNIAGGVAGAAMRAKADDDCDTNKCFVDPYGADHPERDDRRLLTGYNASKRYLGTNVSWGSTYGTRDINNVCQYTIGRISYCTSRRAHLFNYMNDGSWEYGIPQGTVIGIQATPMPNTIFTADKAVYVEECKRDPASIPLTPAQDTPEFKRRQRRVTLCLEWLTANMNRGVLTCMERLLANVVETTPYTICAASVDLCGPENIQVQRGLVRGGRYSQAGPAPQRRIMSSRYFASIMSMFDALMKIIPSLGAAKVASIAREFKPGNNQIAVYNVETVARAIEGVTNFATPQPTGFSSTWATWNVKPTATDTAAWPAWPIAKAMSWEHLKFVLARCAEELDIKGLLIRRSAQSGQITVQQGNQMMRAIRINPREQVQWMPAKTRIPVPYIVAGVGAVSLGVYLFYKATR